MLENTPHLVHRPEKDRFQPGGGGVVGGQAHTIRNFTDVIFSATFYPQLEITNFITPPLAECGLGTKPHLWG